MDQELTRLSVVALAMFNRNRQWVSRAELDVDLPALLDEQPCAASRGTQAPLTAGQIVLSHFYFVHQSPAVRAGDVDRTYEFLHATFGEYLVGRLVVKGLAALANSAEADYGFLYAALSFAALTSRATVVRFVRDGLAALGAARAAPLKQQLLSMFHSSLSDVRLARLGYRPCDLTVPGRHAAWSANLALLVVLVGGEVSGEELFPDGDDGVERWRRICLLWRGQLAVEGWNGMVHTLDVIRDWDGDRRVLRVRCAERDAVVPPLDLHWSYAGAGAQTTERDGGAARWRYYGFEDLRRHSHFQCDRVDDMVMHATEPFVANADACVETVYALADGTATTPAHGLVAVLLSPDETLVGAYEHCLAIAAHGSLAPQGVRAVLRRLLRGDEYRLPPAFVARARRTLDRAVSVAGHATPAGTTRNIDRAGLGCTLTALG